MATKCNNISYYVGNKLLYNVIYQNATILIDRDHDSFLCYYCTTIVVCSAMNFETKIHQHTNNKNNVMTMLATSIMHIMDTLNISTVLTVWSLWKVMDS